MLAVKHPSDKWHHTLVRTAMVYGIMAGLGIMGIGIFFVALGL